MPDTSHPHHVELADLRAKAQAIGMNHRAHQRGAIRAVESLMAACARDDRQPTRQELDDLSNLVEFKQLKAARQ